MRIIFWCALPRKWQAGIYRSPQGERWTIGGDMKRWAFWLSHPDGYLIGMGSRMLVISRPDESGQMQYLKPIDRSMGAT